MTFEKGFPLGLKRAATEIFRGRFPLSCVCVLNILCIVLM